MRNDARKIINKKRFEKTSHFKTDARKILNFKRASVSLSPKKSARSPRKKLFSEKFSIPQRTNTVPVKSFKKQVVMSNDGNLWVTAQSSKNSNTKSSRPNVPSAKEKIRWGPADVDSDNIEGIGIHDIMDMESLPSAVATTNLPSKRPLFSSFKRSLFDEMMGSQNTMVADQVESSSQQQQTAQVLVMNLGPSVSRQDILELFSDIGALKNVEMPQPGLAVVDFFTAKDASTACEAYNNRLLDGQRMECQLLVDVSPEKPSITQRLGERVQRPSPFRPSTESSSSSNSRFHQNPNNVRFTVKLP